MYRFFLLFVLLLVALFTLEITHPVQHAVVVPWTSLLARISATVLGSFDSDVIAHGKVLQDAATGVGVSIEAGCNGVEAFLILAAAVLAYPSRWRFKLAGLVLGFVAIQAVNILRVITLFYLAGWERQIFEFAHNYLWQALIMLDVLVVWLVWIRQVARRETRHGAFA